MARKQTAPMCVFLSIVLAWVAPRLAGERTQDFTENPDWEGVNNRLPVTFPPRLLQSFGYCDTNFAGVSPGEIGGHFQNTVRPAYYGMTIDPSLTMDDALSFSGNLALLEGRAISQWITMGCAYLGFFNSAEQGWRAKNFVGLRFMEFNEPDGCTLEVSVGTGDGAACGMFLNEGGEHAEGTVVEQDASELLRIAPDAQPRTFSLAYKPEEGNGVITFTLDSVNWDLNIPEDVRLRGAVFNRFGLFNEQIPGRDMTIYFDDLTANGAEMDFSKDPSWEASENGEILKGSRVHRVFNDPVLYGSADFGYSPTNYAGGEPGEIGGLLWRVEEPEYMGHCADRTGDLTLEQHLQASGKIAIRKFSIDSGMYIGWFDSEIVDWPPTNFVGVLMDSFTRGGRFFMPMFGTKSDFGHLHPLKSPWFTDDGKAKEFSILYDPEANNGNGRITATLAEKSAFIDLPKKARQEGALMNRFGILNMRKGNGKQCEVYLDDLSYTATE
jgi:hypothetical protein